jgi:hypothetical protein
MSIIHWIPAYDSSVRVALLPYYLFPRGFVLKPKSFFEGNFTVWNEMPKIELIEEQQLQSNSDSFQLQGIEWGKYSSKACIWHMMSMKVGEWKVKSMTRDGVWLLGNLTGDKMMRDGIWFLGNLTGDKSASNVSVSLSVSVSVYYKIENIFIVGTLSENLIVFLTIVVIWCVYATSKVRL